MTTPAGYYDAQGNFIPGSFADQLDLPGPQEIDQGAVDKATGALKAEQTKGKGYAPKIKASQAKQKAYQAQLKNKKLSKAKKASLNRSIAKEKAYQASQSALSKASTAQQTKLQNTVYETSGQYDKLLTGDDRDAYASLRSLFNQFGLGSLAPKIYEFAKQGYGADVISLLLQDTKEYKERFQANDLRAKKGMAVLNPAEYLATEQSYRQILQDAGLPKGFYDNQADFVNWIAGDVSPAEIKGRVDLAVQNSVMANPNSKRALEQLYGVDSSYVTAYFLDEKRALPLLQKQSAAAAFGSEALKRNLLDINKDFLEYMATAGLSQSQVREGYAQIAETLPVLQQIAGRYGESFSQHEAEWDMIEPATTGHPTSKYFTGENPTVKRKRLASSERALWSGSGGATPGGLAASYQQT